MTQPDQSSREADRQGMEHHSHFPRVYLIRHGETEWSLNGRHTGTSDIPLTARGELVMRALGPQIVGKGKLLDPRHLARIMISPRTRAQRTFELLFEPLLEERGEEVVVSKDAAQRVKECNDAGNDDAVCGLPEHAHLPSSLHPMNPLSHLHPVEICDDVQEWDYGDFEGRKSKDIRKDPGFENWNMWVDGCPGGESPQQIADRADRVVARVRELHRRALAAREQKIVASGYQDTNAPPDLACDRGVGDVLIVAHGHFLRVFLARWIGAPSSAGVGWVLDAGGVSVGGYEHGRIQEPAILAINNYALS